MIKSVIENYSREARLTAEQANTTLDKFDALFDRHKNDPRHRLKAQYCYDVRESEKFKATLMAEASMKEILSKQIANIEDMQDLKVSRSNSPAGKGV